jgi:hypothetical protein
VSDLPRPPAERRRRTPVLLGLLAVLVAGGAITAAVLVNGSGGEPGGDAGGNQAAVPSAPTTTQSAPDTGAAPTTSVLPPPTSQPNPTPTPTPPPPPPTTAPAPVPAPVPAPAPAATDPVTFIQNYYGLLPGNTDAAFALLSPAAQAESGGRAGFESFYADIRSVALQNVRETGENTVDATVVFTEQDGSTSSEPYRFVMGTGEDNQTIMQSFVRL